MYGRESDTLLLGFSDDDIQESINYNNKFSRFQNSRFIPAVSLKRLPEKYQERGTRISWKVLKELLGEDEKCKSLNSLKRRRSERTPKYPARLGGPGISSSIPYIIKCGQRSSFQKCKEVNCCANANTRFELHFVLTVGRGRKLSQRVVESVQYGDPCKISKACAYIAASAVGNHPTTILVPANERVVEKVLPPNQSSFLKESAGETRKVERKKWLSGSSSLHVSIARDHAEIIAEKVIAARKKKLMTKKFTTIPRGIKKGILRSDECCCDGSEASAKRSARIPLYNAITGDEEEPPHKKCLIDAASNPDECNSCGETVHRSFTSISPPKENVKTKLNTASFPQPLMVPLFSPSSIAFQQENDKGIDKSSIPANDIHSPESLSECVKALAFREPAVVSLLETPAKVDSGHGPKFIPVIVHPKYLQKLKLKANEDTNIKSAHSVAPGIASPHGNLGEFSDIEHSRKLISGANSPVEIQNSVVDQDPLHSDVADDPCIILAPTESVCIDLTGSDGDGFIVLAPEQSKRLHDKGGNPQNKHENSTEHIVGAGDYSDTIVTDPIPKWGVICTTLPELGFVKVEKTGEKLRLYDPAIVSIPLDFANIHELKRFINSRLANVSSPDLNKIKLEWILVTAGFLRVKTVPPTNPQFWIKLIIPKQTQKTMRNMIAKTESDPQTKEAFIVPIPQSIPINQPQPPNCNGVKNVRPVIRLATVQGTPVSLDKNCELKVSSSGGQCLGFISCRWQTRRRE